MGKVLPGVLDGSRLDPPLEDHVPAEVALIGYQGLWVTMIAEAAGPERVGAATGFAVTFIVATLAASPPLYGLVADLAGTYRAIWAVLACVLACSFVPALLVREHERAPAPRGEAEGRHTLASEPSAPAVD